MSITFLDRYRPTPRKPWVRNVVRWVARIVACCWSGGVYVWRENIVRDCSGHRDGCTCHVCRERGLR